MATKKQIQAWIPSATEIFCSHMDIPVTALPEIHIVSKRELLPVRSALVKKTGCHQRNVDAKHYDSIMEILHGDHGDAIIMKRRLPCISPRSLWTTRQSDMPAPRKKEVCVCMTRSTEANARNRATSSRRAFPTSRKPTRIYCGK